MDLAEFCQALLIRSIKYPRKLLRQYQQKATELMLQPAAKRSAYDYDAAEAKNQAMKSDSKAAARLKNDEKKKKKKNPQIEEAATSSSSSNDGSDDSLPLNGQIMIAYLKINHRAC